MPQRFAAPEGPLSYEAQSNSEGTKPLSQPTLGEAVPLQGGYIGGGTGHGKDNGPVPTDTNPGPEGD